MYDRWYIRNSVHLKDINKKGINTILNEMAFVRYPSLLTSAIMIF